MSNMKCQECQFDSPEAARFCIQCGLPLDLRCPKCGVTTPARGKFCMACGHSLAETGKPQPPPLDYSAPQTYTPKHLADNILTTRFALEGERKLVTVLFADVAHFTSLSEKLDPEEVHQILDGCFQILMAEIHRFEGTINQFTGDGVMALFGAPLAHEDHAQRACHAALSIQSAMGNYGEKLKKDYGIDFQLRIGLNSGPVVVGKIGDDLRMDYTAIGDTTNLASRMQSLASPGTILVSQDTHHLVEAFFQFQPLGKVEIKGKEEPQEAYQLLQPSQVETRIAASVSRGLTRFIGREKEIQTLLEAYSKVQSGSGQVVGIVGEAGVGKSRLLLEFRHFLGEEPLYLEGRCLHYGGSMVYLPFLDVLRFHFEIKEGDREALIKRKLSEKISALDPSLQKMLPPLQELLSLKVEDEAYPPAGAPPEKGADLRGPPGPLPPREPEPTPSSRPGGPSLDRQDLGGILGLSPRLAGQGPDSRSFSSTVPNIPIPGGASPITARSAWISSLSKQRGAGRRPSSTKGRWPPTSASSSWIGPPATPSSWRS